jgi:capsule polysaccharide modification protein KpsS
MRCTEVSQVRLIEFKSIRRVIREFDDRLIYVHQVELGSLLSLGNTCNILLAFSHFQNVPEVLIVSKDTEA